MVAHAGLAVGTWAMSSGHDTIRLRCHSGVPGVTRTLLMGVSSSMAGSTSLDDCSWIAHRFRHVVIYKLASLWCGTSSYFWGGGRRSNFHAISATGYYCGTLEMLSKSDQIETPQQSGDVGWLVPYMYWLLSNDPSSTPDFLAMVWSELLHSTWEASVGSSGPRSSSAALLKASQSMGGHWLSSHLFMYIIPHISHLCICVYISVLYYPIESG